MPSELNANFAAFLPWLQLLVDRLPPTIFGKNINSTQHIDRHT